MGLPARMDDRHSPCGDARTWPEVEHWELIDGIATRMSPPSYEHGDLRLKHAVHQKHGVPEYWIIAPIGRWLQQYLLKIEEQCGPENLQVQKGTVVCQALEGFELDLSTLWSGTPRP